MKAKRRDWLKRQVDAGKMEAKTVFQIEHDGTGANDVYGGDWKPARIRRPKFREHYPDPQNRPDWHYGVCADSDFVDGKMNFNESDFRSGSGGLYEARTCQDGRPIYCLHVHSNAVFNFRPTAEAFAETGERTARGLAKIARVCNERDATLADLRGEPVTR